LPTITTSHSAIFVRPLLMIRLSQLPLPLFASAWTIPSSHSVLHKNQSATAHPKHSLVRVIALQQDTHSSIHM